MRVVLFVLEFFKSPIVISLQSQDPQLRPSAYRALYDLGCGEQCAMLERLVGEEVMSASLLGSLTRPVVKPLPSSTPRSPRGSPITSPGRGRVTGSLTPVSALNTGATSLDDRFTSPDPLPRARSTNSIQSPRTSLRALPAAAAGAAVVSPPPALAAGAALFAPPPALAAAPAPAPVLLAGSLV